jgi:hypothetical protein
MVDTATPPLYLVDGNLSLEYEAPFSVQPAAYVSEASRARLRFWMVRHIGAMGIDNTNVMGMDYAALPAGVAIVEWKAGIGEIEYDDRPRLRENFVDVTPYCPFIQQFMTRLTGITLDQAKRLQKNLIDVLYDSKRQMNFHYAVAAGDYWWEATDNAMTTMSNAVIPGLINAINKLGGETGAGTDSLVNQINTQWATQTSQLNANYTNQTNQLNANYTTQASQTNTNCIDKINGNANASTALVGNVNADAGTINSYIVASGNNLVTYINGTMLGGHGDGLNTINNKLFTASLASTEIVASPGLDNNISHANINFSNVSGSGAGFVTTSYVSTPSVSMPSITTPSVVGSTPSGLGVTIQWQPVGQSALVTLSHPEISGIMKGVSDRRNNLANVQVGKKIAVDALTTVGDVIAYDVTAGWPIITPGP